MQFLDGHASGSTLVSESFGVVSGAASDALTLRGATDTFVLELKVDPSLVTSTTSLNWLNGSGQWVAAVEGNVGGTSNLVLGALTGYSRLRVGRSRLIFWYAPDTAVEVVFVGDRSVVYEIFEAEFVKKLKARYPDQETSPGDFQVQEPPGGLDSKPKRKAKKKVPSRKAASAEIKGVMKDYSRTMRRLSATEVYERGAAKYRNALRELSKQ